MEQTEWGLGDGGLHNKTIAGTAETMVLASTQHVFEHLTARKLSFFCSLSWHRLLRRTPKATEHRQRTNNKESQTGSDN